MKLGVGSEGSSEAPGVKVGMEGTRNWNRKTCRGHFSFPHFPTVCLELSLERIVFPRKGREGLGRSNGVQTSSSAPSVFTPEPGEPPERAHLFVSPHALTLMVSSTMKKDYVFCLHA